uniref:Uncharacterized protein n=1 Tax=Glossina palpalis gambiensis TaxID=67801 RepID=A0A1B0BTM9_9MUSC
MIPSSVDNFMFSELNFHNEKNVLSQLKAELIYQISESQCTVRLGKLINGNYRRMDMVLAENCGFVVEALKKRLHVKRQNAARKSTL